jgi:hypothetical protein
MVPVGSSSFAVSLDERLGHCFDRRRSASTNSARQVPVGCFRGSQVGSHATRTLTNDQPFWYGSGWDG